LAVDIVLLAAAALPVTAVPRTGYSPRLAEARKRIGRRGPDDVEFLALAMQFEVPIWSNDSDFEDAGVVWYTAASLLAALESE
jgi:predicted nucleic acid-binding protein